MFRTFDSICKNHYIQKIETVGKTYMAAGGLKFIEGKLEKDVKIRDFALRTVDAAQKMLEYTQRYMYKAGKHLKVKIGVHYGSCIFGVLGYHKPQFSLIGDTINTTSRHCSTAEAETIALSTECHQMVKKAEDDLVAKLGESNVDRLLFQVN